MKKTIIYEDVYKSDIPVMVDGMRLVNIAPIKYEDKNYECEYRSDSALKLAEQIAQRNNKEQLERIKPLTIGYIGSSAGKGGITKWGGEKYKCHYIDDYKSNGGYTKIQIDLSKYVSPEKIFWHGIIRKLAPSNQLTIDELVKAYRKKVKPPRKVEYGRPSRAKKPHHNHVPSQKMKKSKLLSVKNKKENKVVCVVIKKHKTPEYLNMISANGKYKYVSLVRDGVWRVQAKYKGISYRRGSFYNYEEACAAADELAIEINKKMGVNNEQVF